MAVTFAQAQQVFPLPNKYKATEGNFILTDKLSVSSSKEALPELMDPFAAIVEHYFLRRMADSIQKRGKTMIGWNKGVTAGLGNHPLVMWWRHDKTQMLETALKNGYDVILGPRIPMYFDFVQMDSHKSGQKWSGKFGPIESVYDFPSEKLTGGLPVNGPQIKGIQANYWTENFHTAERLEFMTFPRLSALAGASWTYMENKDYAGFQTRVDNMTDIYKKSGVSYFDFLHPVTAREIAGPEKLPK